MEHIAEGIGAVVAEWDARLRNLPTDVINGPRNRQNRNIRQIVGHLVDSASNNHQRIVRLQYNAVLEFPDYRQDNDRWIVLQDYETSDWQELTALWKYYNLHLMHVIRAVRTDALDNRWADFEGNEVTLREMIAGYLDHLNLHLGEIEKLINTK